MPLFIRGGAIVPMGPVCQHLSAHVPGEITLLTYPGGNARFTLYDDDGETNAWRRGGHALTDFTAEQGEGVLFLRIAAVEGDTSLVPAGRVYTFQVRAPADPSSVTRDGNPAEWRRDGHFPTHRRRHRPDGNSHRMVRDMAKKAASDANGGVAAKGRVVLEAFDYQDVRLLPGRLRDQVDQARELYGAIPDDDILKGFRREAGLPAPSAGMKGWCQSTSAVIFGQLVSGMVRLGRATGDRSLIDKATRLFDGWAATVRPDGNARMRAYDWDKLVCGLVDLARYGDVEAAIPALKRSVAWAARTFDRTRKPADGHDFWGAGPGDTSEWYTLSENLYRAYLVSGDMAFKDFADVWLYEDYWRDFAESAEPASVQAVHAYSHVNSFSSAAAAYLVTGDERYLRICINGYDFILVTQCYATGGYGPDERLMPPDGSLGRSLDVLGYQAEVPCGSWAAFKLSMYLMGFTGEARFGDWIETTLYNGMAASLPPEPDGKSFYYGDYSISGGMKTFYWHEWPCCSGTYIQNTAEYYNMVFLKDDTGLYVNLYVPSEVRWRRDGREVMLRQVTDYPESETSTITLSLDGAARFALHFRIPGWSTGAMLAVNGEAMEIAAEPGRWAIIDREWLGGDHVTITIPMTLRTVPVDLQHPGRAAIMVGPVVLAQVEACCRRPFALAPTTALTTRLVKEPDGLRFRITNTVPERHTRYLQPLYSVPAFWPYWVYFDLTAPPLY